MFDDFANVWTIVGFAKDLKRDKPLAMTVANERVVLFRDADGRPAALIDRCPHRGVALSLGCVRGGEIECPFHGWRFSGDGANRRAPWNPDAKRENLAAIALAAREAGGLLWLRAAPGPSPDEPSPSPSLFAPGVSVSGFSVTWRVHWTRVMENMLDSPHTAFVHRRSFGRPLGERLAAHPAARMDVSWEARDYGASIGASVEGEPRPALLDYRFPNAMELTLDFRGRLFRLMAICIPVGDMETRLMLVTIRDFLRAPLFDPLFSWLNRRIAEEDRSIVESSLPPRAPPPGEDVSVRTDAATLAFRHVYRQRLLGGRA